MKDRSTYRIKAGEGLAFSDFERMEALEETFYSHDFITPATEAYRWYEMHPRSIVTAFDGNEIAGFVNLLPLAGKMLERALAGELNDAELTAEDIPPFDTLETLVEQTAAQQNGPADVRSDGHADVRSDGHASVQSDEHADVQLIGRTSEDSDSEPFALFLSCIVVAEEHRGNGLAQELLRTALNLYVPPAHGDTRVITDNVTADGCRFSERMGFTTLKQTTHGSQLYVTTLRELCERIAYSA